MSERRHHPAVPERASALRIDLFHPIRRGAILTLVGFGGFIAWASLAPLTSAAVAPGIVIADGRNKPVQHLEGGLIEAVLVNEGDTVREGEILARLKSATATAGLGRLETTRLSLLAEEARLLAERDGMAQIAFPAALTGKLSDPRVKEALRGQEILFATRAEKARSESAIIDQRIAQSEAEIRATQSQAEAERRQQTFIREELTTVRKMVEQGYERRPRLLALERSAADLEGRVRAREADIARSRRQIAELEDERARSKATRIDETVAQLRETQTKLADIEEQIAAASDATDRLLVRAPASGRIVMIGQKTQGSVIRPGDTIMEILPDTGDLLIEAQLRPEDIDDVALGAKARIRLTGLSARWESTLSGTVEYVSADRVVDQRQERTHFIARIRVTLTDKDVDDAVTLYPGMPAAVFIETGEQSLLAYLLTPIIHGMDRGLREK
ncbi:MAG: HlyD family type I secretion periplasmic adaptor subunit [Alphaproteobacteria bacterium]|nr:HlyD family type I secretion periplasmic adaptor subunit [Alphaproteobacteria bacterium]